MRRYVGLMVFLLAIVLLTAACAEDSPVPRGDTGETGSQGETGPQGIRGIQGKPGTESIRGTQGIQGDRGEPGLRGEKGDKGDPGDSLSEEFIELLLNRIVNPPTSTPEPFDKGSYEAPDPRFVFSYTTGADGEIGGLDIYLIKDPIFDHPGCPKQSEVFGQSARGDSVRCRFDPSFLLSWIKEFSLVTKLPLKDMEWSIYTTLTPYQGLWPVPEETQEPKPRFLVEFEEFEKEHSGNILLTVFLKDTEPTPRCPDQADKGDTKSEGETEYYRCIASPEATLRWLQKFSLAEDLPPREEWGKIYAIFPALFPWET